MTDFLPELLTVLLNRVAERSGPDRKLPHNPDVLHRAFYELHRDYAAAFPAIGELRFITAGAFPYSPDLTEAMDVLQFSGALSRDNPSYDRFSPKRYDDSDELLAEEAKKLTAGKTAEFERLVDDLTRALAV